MVNAVGHRIDEVLTEHPCRSAIVLNQVEPGFNSIFIISVKFYPFIVIITLNVLVDEDDIIGRDLFVFGNTGFPDGFIDDFIHSVGCVGGFGNFLIGDVFVKPFICHDRIGDSIQAGTRCRVVGVELRQPLCNLINRSILVTVFIENIVPLNFKAEMIDAVSNRVDQIVSTVSQGCPVVLDQVEPGFHTVFVITMQVDPFLLVVCPDIGIDLPYIISGYYSVIHRSGCLDSFGDDVVHGCSGFGSAFYILL